MSKNDENITIEDARVMVQHMQYDMNAVEDVHGHIVRPEPKWEGTRAELKEMILSRLKAVTEAVEDEDWDAYYKLTDWLNDDAERIDFIDFSYSGYHTKTIVDITNELRRMEDD